MVFIGQVFRKCFSLFTNVSNSNNKKPREFYKKNWKYKNCKKKTNICKKKSKCSIRKPITILNAENCSLMTFVACAYAKMMQEY